MLESRGGFDLTCEWGASGVASLAPTAEVVVVVDVLSFCTCVDVAISRGGSILPYRWKDATAAAFAAGHGAELAGARGGSRYSLSPSTYEVLPAGGRVVLPSPNGAAAALAAPPGRTMAGCLRNASSVAVEAARRARRIAVIPAGERWPDGSMRPALEDWLGAGAILARLPGLRSPEAEAAVAAFEALRGSLQEALLSCASGRELVERGFRCDVETAAALDVSRSVPVFDGTAFAGAT